MPPPPLFSGLERLLLQIGWKEKKGGGINLHPIRFMGRGLNSVYERGRRGREGETRVKREGDGKKGRRK